MTEFTDLQERLAYLERALDDLSEVAARQQGEIDRLTRRVALLMEREAGRHADSGELPMEDKPPPHW